MSNLPSLYRENEVFISYSHDDAEVADEIVDILERLGVSYFRDIKDIEWGDRINSRVQEGLANAEMVIVVISPGSLKSGWVIFEVGIATGLSVRLMPYLTHPAIDLPEFPSDRASVTRLDEVERYFSNRRSHDSKPILEATAAGAAGMQEVQSHLVSLQTLLGVPGTLTDAGHVREEYDRTIECIIHELSRPVTAIRYTSHRLQQLRSLDEAFESPSGDLIDDLANWAEYLCGAIGNVTWMRPLADPEHFESTMSQVLLHAEVVRPAVSRVAVLLKERRFDSDRIRFVGAERVPTIWLNLGAMQQVVFNVVSNAIKYAYTQQSIFDVEIAYKNLGSGGFSMSLSDWGRGAEESLGRDIFEKGVRGNRAIMNDATGQGNGLWIVEQIVRLHGGEVDITSWHLPFTLTVTLPERLARDADAFRR